MTRKTTWANADGLNVGFGPNYPERNDAGALQSTASIRKVLKCDFTYQSTFGASGAKITLPAGAAVTAVWMKVGHAFVGGTSLAFGDASGTGSWVTATQGAEASLTDNTTINAQGAYANTATEGALVPKVYAAATDLYLTSVGTHTAGSGSVYVEYV